MNLACARIEGRRIDTLAAAGALFTRELDRHAQDAQSGSRKLRDAIWKLQGYTPPKRHLPVKLEVEPIRQPELCPTCLGPIKPPPAMIASIQQTVAAYYGIERNQMTSNIRQRHIAHARQVAMYLACQLTKHSIADVSRRFNRDHTTVLHALKAVETRAEDDHQLAFDISLLRERLTA